MYISLTLCVCVGGDANCYWCVCVYVCVYVFNKALAQIISKREFKLVTIHLWIESREATFRAETNVSPIPVRVC